MPRTAKQFFRQPSDLLLDRLAVVLHIGGPDVPARRQCIVRSLDLREGRWTVGSDIEPGSDRAADP